MSSSFDGFADEYQTHCMRGLALSGENAEFFAKGRISHLKAWWLGKHLPSPKNIIDLGCGIGDSTMILADSFPSSRILGLDTSSKCVDVAESRCSHDRISFQTTDSLQDWPLADLVFVNGVLHHVPVGERSSFVRECRLMTRRKGIVAIFENNPLNLGTRLVMSRIPFDKDAVMISCRSLKKLLMCNQLEPLESGYLFFFPSFLRAFRFMELWLKKFPFGAQYYSISINGGPSCFA